MKSVFITLALLLCLVGCSQAPTQPTRAALVLPVVTPTAAMTVAVVMPTAVSPTAVLLTAVPPTQPIVTPTLPPTFTASPFLDLITPSPTPSPTPCPPGQVQTGTFPSVLAGESKYRIYLPPCYGMDGRVYPTLYLFGGNTHDDSAWDNYGLDEAAEAAIRSGDLPPMLIVMADGGWIANSTSGGPTSYEGHILDNLIPFIEATYCTWNSPEGRAIGGLSRGGYWSLEIAFRHPELFKSVGGHSPALIDSHADEFENPQFTGLTNDLGDLRIYMDIGADDYLLPNTLKLHEDMVAQGVPHTWFLNEGAHEDSYWPQHLTEYLLWYGEPWPVERSGYAVGDCGT